jgi:sulfur-oxidizing protein SoxY
MSPTRRTFLRLIAVASALVARRSWGLAPPAAALPVEAGAFAKALAEEAGSGTVADSDAIQLETPLIAENGAIVPISVETALAGVRELVILVERNPTPVAARFALDPSLDSYVSLRIKMNESGDVVALAKTASGCFAARKRVQVVVGGCG